MNKKQITITISGNNYIDIEKIRNKMEWSRSFIVREALKDFLKKYQGDFR
jgi:metal-responsive CopG/Arc/MetJ family transcriptional regulator